MAADGGRKALRGLGVLLALGLSVAAVLLVVFGNDAKTIRVGVILGAWGLMFGGLSLYPRRNAPSLRRRTSSPRRPATSTALELRDDAAARREFERVLEAMLHRELDRGLRSELDSLRGEMAGLRGEVSQAMRNQVSLERVETRIVGADLAELQDEVRRRGPAVEPKPHAGEAAHAAEPGDHRGDRGRSGERSSAACAAAAVVHPAYAHTGSRSGRRRPYRSTGVGTVVGGRAVARCSTHCRPRPSAAGHAGAPSVRCTPDTAGRPTPAERARLLAPPRPTPAPPRCRLHSSRCRVRPSGPARARSICPRPTASRLGRPAARFVAVVR